MISEESILSSFPFSFRGNQKWALGKIASALNMPNVKFVVVQAPTGSGKSPFAIALSRAAEESYILTSNKMLQDQYVNDFDQYISDLRGRANYRCLKTPGYTCANAPCRGSPSGRGNCGIMNGGKVKGEKPVRECEYHLALDAAKISKVTSMNFAGAIAFFNFTPLFPARKLLLIDEAHLVPDNLSNFIEFSISANQLGKMLPAGSSDIFIIPVLNNVGDYLPWLQIVSDRLTQEVKVYTAPSSVDKMIGNNTTFEQLETFSRKIALIINEIKHNRDNFVLDHKYSDIKQTVVDSVAFKPVDVSAYAHDKLFRFGEKVLLMSATVVDYEEFTRSLGIKQSECVFIDVPSTFPKENRPIVRNYVGTLNRGNMDTLMPSLINSIKEVLRSHKTDKGIIHSHSYKNAKTISDALRAEFGERILFPENSAKQAEILAKHKSSTVPTVLLSPSMTEGVDLKDDLSRFQVIVKVPYPSMGDKVVVARMNKNPNWYGFRTMLTLIQAYGRSTRSETDHSVTYILDGAFESLLSRYRKRLPSWFTDAIL